MIKLMRNQILENFVYKKHKLDKNLDLEKNLKLRQQNTDVEKFGSPKQHLTKGKVICEEDSLHYLCLLRDVQRDRSLLLERQDANSAEDRLKNGNLCELWMEDILEAIEVGMKNVNVIIVFSCSCILTIIESTHIGP